MRRRPVVAIVILLLAAAGLAAWLWYGSAEREAKAIRGSGTIEVTQVDAAFEVPGRMVERYADEGVSLDRGEPIARLDERQLRGRVGGRCSVPSVSSCRGAFAESTEQRPFFLPLGSSNLPCALSFAFVQL